MQSLSAYIFNDISENLIKTKLKGKNALYHSTQINHFYGILIENTLIGYTKQIRKATGKKTPNLSQMPEDEYKRYYKEYEKSKIKGISLTRDWNLNYGGSLTFILDGDKLKSKFGRKLKPIDYYGNNDNHRIYPEDEFPFWMSKNNPNRPKDSIESEEFLEIEKLPNLDKYILGFIIDNYILKDKKLYDEIIGHIKDYLVEHNLNNIELYDLKGNLLETF